MIRPEARRDPLAARSARTARAATSDVSPRWRAGWVAAGLSSLGVALACLFGLPWAADVLPIGMPALHRRCIGAAYLAAATCLLVLARQRDSAVVRIPLNMVGVGAAALALAACTVAPGAWLYVLVHAAVASAAAAWAWQRRELTAPSERPDAAMLLMAAVMVTVALALALWPQPASARWPWPMPAPVAAFYAAPMLACSLAAAQVARERRRAARRIALIGLCVMGSALLGASAWHWTLFRGLAAWSWFPVIGSGTALAAHRLLRGAQPALR